MKKFAILIVVLLVVFAQAPTLQRTQLFPSTAQLQPSDEIPPPIKQQFIQTKKWADSLQQRLNEIFRKISLGQSWTSGTGDNIYRKDGNVGIGGTASPGVKLQIDGAHTGGKGIVYLNSTDHAYIGLNAAANNESGMILKTNDINKWVIKNNNTDSDKLYFISRVGSDQNRLIIDQDGNVGIGKVNPGTKLDIYNGWLRLSSDTSGGSFIITEHAGLARINAAATGGGGTVAIGREPVVIHGLPTGAYSVELWSGTDGGTRTLVASGGNVGIGTTAMPTSAGKYLVFGIADSNSPSIGANTAGLYADNVAASGELFAIDEGGTTAQLTDDSEELYYDPNQGAYIPTARIKSNPYAGIRQRLDLWKLARAVEQITGEQIITIEKLPKSECRDWDTDERARIDKRNQEIVIANETKFRLIAEIKQIEDVNIPALEAERDILIADCNELTFIGTDEEFEEKQREKDAKLSELAKAKVILKNKKEANASMIIPGIYEKRPEPSWIKKVRKAG